MDNKEFKSFSDFLKKTPKNLMSIIVLNVFGLVAIIGTTITRDSLDPQWVYWPIILFCLLIMGMAWYRVYDIYRDL